MTQMYQKKSQNNAQKNPHNSSEKKIQIHEKFKVKDVKCAQFYPGNISQNNYELQMEIANDFYTLSENYIGETNSSTRRNENQVKYIKECSFNATQINRPKTEVARVHSYPLKNSTNNGHQSTSYKMKQVANQKLEVGMHKKASSYSNTVISRTP